MRFYDILLEAEEKQEEVKVIPGLEDAMGEISAHKDRELRTAPVREEIASEHDFFWRREELKLVRVKNDRAFFRLETNLKAVVVPMERFGVGEISARVLNVSAGGMGIGTSYQCCVGDRLLLKVRLVPEEEAWNLFCQVVRIEEKGISGFVYGCRVIELSEGEQERLRLAVLRLEERLRG